MSDGALAASIAEAAEAEARRQSGGEQGPSLDVLAFAEAVTAVRDRRVEELLAASDPALGQDGGRQGQGPMSASGQGTGVDRWVTLREAAEVAGVSVSALRKAYREERLDSRLEAGPYGEQRMVELGQVLERIGRGRPEGAAAAVGVGAGLEPGAMLVPAAAWQGVLEQLGHLHQAGQELAEARERAAKAETEAAFLRERLAEMRARLETPPAAVTPAPGQADEGRGRRWWRR